MHKGNKAGQGNGACSGAGGMPDWWLSVKLPQFCGWDACAIMNDIVAAANCEPLCQRRQFCTQHHTAAQWIEAVVWLTGEKCGHVVLVVRGAGSQGQLCMLIV